MNEQHPDEKYLIVSVTVFRFHRDFVLLNITTIKINRFVNFINYTFYIHL